MAKSRLGGFNVLFVLDTTSLGTGTTCINLLAIVSTVEINSDQFLQRPDIFVTCDEIR